MSITAEQAVPPDLPDPDLIFRRRLRAVDTMRELWRSRELVVALSERELRARYKQTKMGFAWAVVTPFMFMIVFTIFLKGAANVDSSDVPYPLFAYLGLLPWTFFSNSFSKGALSLTSNLSLLNKVYCPREVFPLAAVAVAVVDTTIATSILGILFIAYQFAPKEELVWVPLLMVVQLAFTVGTVLIASTATVYLRDVRQLVPMALQFALFATPVAYGLDVISESWQPLYALLNPLAPVIDGYRRTVLLGESPDLDLLGLGALTSTILLVAGYVMFKRLETGIADVA